VRALNLQRCYKEMEREVLPCFTSVIKVYLFIICFYCLATATIITVLMPLTVLTKLNTFVFSHNMIDFIPLFFSGSTRERYSAVAFRSVTSLCSENTAGFKEIELLIQNGHVLGNLEAR